MDTPPRPPRKAVSSTGRSPASIQKLHAKPVAYASPNILMRLQLNNAIDASYAILAKSNVLGAILVLIALVLERNANIQLVIGS